MQGEIPVYRDLVPGISGDDVLQLESGLKRLGFSPGQVDGTYDEKTSEAVADWYAKADFEAFGPTGEQLVALHSLEDELALATNQKLAAEDTLAAAPLAVEAARAKMNYDVAAASGSKKAAAQLEGEMAVQAALDTQKAAEREVERLKSLVERISSDFDAAKLKAGVQVPIDEIVFIPSLPVRVEETNVDIGEPANGAVMTVTNNQLLIDSSLPLAEAPLVKPGLPVNIDEPDLGIKATGVVSHVADTPGTDGVDGFHIYFETLVDETSAKLEGFSLRLTIPVESTGEKVMVVPVSALSLAADGTSRVQVQNGGNLDFVSVEPGLSADGYVEVKPVDGTLTPGQFVVIGYENAE
jgi:peptidoglycan hydrolase-like protein with peptidoglycan-binding domain